MLTRAVTRGARRAARHRPTCRSGRSRSRTTEAVENAVRFVKDGGRRRRQARGRRPDADARRRRSSTPASPSWVTSGSRRSRPTLLGGYKAQGRTAARRAARCATTRSRSSAPAASPSCSRRFRPVAAARSRRRSTIPTIGIGAGPSCDGQVLVWHDLLGLTSGHVPQFVKQYADLAAVVEGGARRVRGRRPHAPVPRGPAHLPDGGGGAGPVRAGQARQILTVAGSDFHAWGQTPTAESKFHDWGQTPASANHFRLDPV